MRASEIITHILSNNIEAILGGKKPVLVACIRGDIDCRETIKELESVAIISRSYPEVCYALEDLLPYFRLRYGVTGTPTFLLIEEWVLLDSVLGKSSAKDLTKFIRSHFTPSGLEVPPSKRRKTCVRRVKSAAVTETGIKAGKRGIM